MPQPDCSQEMFAKLAPLQTKLDEQRPPSPAHVQLRKTEDVGGLSGLAGKMQTTKSTAS